MMRISSNASLRTSVNRTAISRPLPCNVTSTSARTVAVRASPDDGMGNTGPAPSAGTIFYGGKAYTEVEYQAAVDSGAVAMAPAPTPSTSSAMPSLMEIMSFAGNGPEIINGRLAMLGFVAAVGAELSSGDSILRQIGEEPTGIGAVFALFMAGSLVPFINGSKRTESLGPFSPNAEMINGRAAMIGFAAMLVIERVSGQALL